MEMNGFAILAETYRRKGGAEDEIRIFDFLKTCSEKDFCTMFDTGAFNDIACAYLRQAVSELMDEGTLDKEQGRAVRNRFRYLFSEFQAKEALKK